MNPAALVLLLLALVAFLVAAVLGWRPDSHARPRWASFVAAGLALWVAAQLWSALPIG